MKIQPLSFRFVNKSANQKINSQIFPNYNHRLSNDTVNFSGNYIQDAYDDLNETVNNKIIPFYNDNKETYQELIGIGNKYYSVFDQFTKSELDLILKKSSYQNPNPDESLEPFQPFVERGYSQEETVSNYKNLKSVLSDDFYAQKELQEALNQADLVMGTQNPEMMKIQPLYDKYKETFISIQQYNDTQTLKLENEPLSDKLDEIRKTTLTANAYIFLMPIRDIAKLVKSTKEIEQELKNPSQSLMKTHKVIEHLQYSADSILNDINNYNFNKASVASFVEKEKQNSVKIPSESDIKSVYASLIENCDNNFQKCIKELNKYYQEEYLNKGVNIDFNSVDKILNQQKTILENLYAMKKSIDQEYINKNNENF